MKLADESMSTTILQPDVRLKLMVFSLSSTVKNEESDYRRQNEGFSKC